MALPENVANLTFALQAAQGTPAGANQFGMFLAGGTMPGAMYADVYATLWDLHLRGERDQLREIFSKLMLMINLDAHIPGVRNYVFKRRGIFKTSVSRKADYTWSREAVEEIEHNLAGLAPYLKIKLPS